MRQCRLDLYAKVKRKENRGGYRGSSSLELKGLEGNFGKEQTLRSGSIDLIDREFRLKKNNRLNLSTRQCN
jgi:hypothetical protein